MKAHREAIGGALIALMVLSTLAAGTLPSISALQPFWLSGVFGLLAAVVLLPNTRISQRIQLALLISIGTALIIFSQYNGVDISWASVFAQNTPLLSMVVSVGLLKIVVSKVTDIQGKLPVGRKAYLHTLISLSIFGSIINISAPVLIADRLTLNRTMSDFTAAALSRTFCSCAAWSPFFAGAAIVFTVVPGIRIPVLIVFGLPFLFLAVAIQYWGAVLFQSQKLETFSGYPIRLDSLFIPLLLAAMVLLAGWLVPSISILMVISLSAIVLTTVLLSLREGVSTSTHILSQFVLKDFAKSVNELQLFLSAGVLASGLKGLAVVEAIQAPFTVFSSDVACLLLGIMVIVSACGIHPVIQIVSLTPLILATHPQPELLGLTYLFVWALGTCASPLSGTQLILQGRYGIDAWRGATQNWPFVFLMYLIACLILTLIGSVLN